MFNMLVQQLVALQTSNMFQHLEPLGPASQQHVPTFTRPGAVGAAFHLEALNFEQNQLKNHSKSLKISKHSFFWPISEGLGNDCCIFSQLLPPWVVQPFNIVVNI